MPTGQIDPHQPTDLYRFFDSDGVLLYVGMTCAGVGRWKRHRAEKPWWPEVVSITVEHLPDRAQAALVEREAIINENPRYNLAGGKALVSGIRVPAGSLWQHKKYGNVVQVEGPHEGCPDMLDCIALPTGYRPRCKPTFIHSSVLIRAYDRVPED